MKETDNPTKKCPICAEEISADAVKCWFCCSDIQPRICAKCGNQNQPAAKFCDSCGCAVGSSETRTVNYVSDTRTWFDKWIESHVTRATNYIRGARQRTDEWLETIKFSLAFLASKLPIISVALLAAAILSVLLSIRHTAPKPGKPGTIAPPAHSDMARGYSGMPVISATSTDNMGEIQRVVDLNLKSMKESSGEFQMFLKQIRELRLENVLAFKTLEDVYRSERTIALAQKIVVTYSRSYEDRMAEMDAYVFAMSLSESSKKSFLAAYNKSREEKLAFARRFIAIQNGTLNSMSDVLGFVKTKGSLADGVLRFSNQEDTETYNAKAAEVLSASKREAEWFEEMRKRIEEDSPKLAAPVPPL
jgi:hypothetical protein